jgi:hypothetical protein
MLGMGIYMALMLWGLPALIKKVFFNSQPISKTVAWAITIPFFFVNYFALIVMDTYMVSSAKEAVGVSYSAVYGNPSFPFSAIALSISYFFYKNLNTTKKIQSITTPTLITTPREIEATLGVQTSSPAVPVIAPVTTTTRQPAPPPFNSTPSEDAWATALAEFEGANRHAGLWARAFAESQGNEVAAKAAYLGYRAQELQQIANREIARQEAQRQEVQRQEEARLLLEKAEQGNAVAQFNLGVKYATGQGIARNDAEAVKWFRLAVNQGNADAQNSLGFMYATGQGVARNDAEAVKWFHLAAYQGNADAQNSLGFMYENGLGVAARNDAEAVEWYRMAAKQGDAKGQYNLGVKYATGQGIARNDAEAVKWLRLAADQGLEEARSVLRALSSRQ